MKRLVAYIGYKARPKNCPKSDKHITLAFADVMKTEKLFMRSLPQYFDGVVNEIEYWERVDLTVATIHYLSNGGDIAINKIRDAGFDYDLEFIPHITLGKGDLRKECEHFIRKNDTVYFDNPYIKIMELDK